MYGAVSGSSWQTMVQQCADDNCAQQLRTFWTLWDIFTNAKKRFHQAGMVIYSYEWSTVRGRTLATCVRSSMYCFNSFTSSKLAALSTSLLWASVETNGIVSLHKNTHTHTSVLRPFFRDHPGEPVPEENFWTLWCKGRLREADTPSIRLGATPSELSSAHLHHPPFFTDQMPFLPPNQQCQSTEGNKTHTYTQMLTQSLHNASWPHWRH